MKTFLISINNILDIPVYESNGFKTFLFPLKDYSVGYPDTFYVNQIPPKIDAYLLINRLLDTLDVDKLESALKELPSFIKGIVYEDIAVFQIVKRLNLKIELIWFQNHFGTNHEIINFWLDEGVDSTFISNELHKTEIEAIVKSAKKPQVVQIFGLNQIMYSRRLLLTNYQLHYNLPLSNKEIIYDKVKEMKFIIYENTYGTTIYYYNVYSALELLTLDNIKFFFVNTVFLETESVLLYLKNIDNFSFNLDLLNIPIDNGFLDIKTIYKLSEEER